MIVAAKRIRRHKRRCTKRISIRWRAAHLKDHFRDPSTGLTQRILKAPQIFSIVHPEMRMELMAFLDDIKQALLIEGRRVYIDFTGTTKMYADGTILFYAFLYRLSPKIQPEKMVRCSYPKDPIVEQVLSHIGIFDVLNKRVRIAIEHDTVKYWCNATGTQVEGQKLARLPEIYSGTMATSLQSKLYAGITEAMTNSGHHAYPTPESMVFYGINVDKRWWMFSQEREGILTVAFCDLGIGIPNSISTGGRWLPDLVSNILRQLGYRHRTDGSLIRAAFELGKTKTRQRHRGKGLQEIKDVLDTEGQGRVLVFSGNGVYRYEPAKQIEQIGHFAQAIPGTLISWNIPIRHRARHDTHTHNKRG